MRKEYIITLSAANRVGILAAVTNAMEELGGDILETSVTLMRGFFTVIVAADFPAHRDPQVIVDHISGVGNAYGIEVTLKDPVTDLPQQLEEDGARRYLLEATGENQPGMMRLVASRLATDGIDIADLYAARTGDGRFRMTLEITVPSDTDVRDVERDLEERGREAGLRAKIAPLEGPPAHQVFSPPRRSGLRRTRRPLAKS